MNFQNIHDSPLIPDDKKDAVASALRESFGVSVVDEIRTLTGGLSGALVFRIVVSGRPYLLRVIVKTGGAVGPGQGDQTNHFACMKHAAEAGIGPRVWYASADDGVSITDLIEAQPFPRTEALAVLPLTLQRLHALPPFPAPKAVNYLDAMDRMARKFLAFGILPERETAELLDLYTRVAAVYPRDDSEKVPSHNDLRPENILFDGARVWLVDWEAAFSNDRYLDLAVVANFVVTNDAEEAAYLRTYFGEDASEYRRARLYLMRQLLHVFYPAFLFLYGGKRESIDSITPTPDFHDFHARIRAGEVDLADDDAKMEYAKAHMNELPQNGRTARFQEALRIVSAGA